MQAGQASQEHLIIMNLIDKFLTDILTYLSILWQALVILYQHKHSPASIV